MSKLYIAALIYFVIGLQFISVIGIQFLWCFKSHFFESLFVIEFFSLEWLKLLMKNPEQEKNV